MYICEDSFADQLVSMLKKDLFQLGIVKGKEDKNSCIATKSLAIIHKSR